MYTTAAALSIDPAVRHADTVELGNDLEQLGRWYRETLQGIALAQAEKNPVVQTQVFKGPSRSRTDEALDEMKTSIKDFGEILQELRAQQDVLSEQLQSAAQNRRVLWAGLALVACLQVTLYYQQRISEPPSTAAAALVIPDEGAGAAQALAEDAAADDAAAGSDSGDVSEEVVAEESLEEVVAAEPAGAPVEPSSVEAAPEVAPAPSAAASDEALSSAAQAAADGIVSVPELSAGEPPGLITSTGSISVAGATAWLMGPEGRVSPGVHEPGAYEVFVAQEGGAPYSLGTVQLAAGDAIQFNCGFGTCKQIQ